MKLLACAVFAALLAFCVTSAGAADVTESQWVRASEDGTIAGRVVVPRGEEISAVRNARVSLLDENGKIAGSLTKSDNTGRFVIEDVVPGVYTLTVEGKDTFACCAMHVVKSTVAINNSFEIAAAALDPKVAREVAMRYLPAEARTEVEFNPDGNPLVTGRALVGEMTRVVQRDGGLKGRLTKAGFGEIMGLSNANVMIFKDGVEVARTTTDSEGNFSVADLAPGSYSVLGSSPEGFGVMGLELVDPLAVQSVSRGRQGSAKFVAQASGVNDTFVMQVAPLPSAGTIISDRLISEEEIVGPAIPLDATPGMVADGGFGFAPSGGGFGGGGAGGGIGGGGGLGGVGLLGGVGAALAIGLSDDDDDIVVPPPASPATP